jgi:membrane-bound lytic murein transglycosylase MltF
MDSKVKKDDSKKVANITKVAPINDVVKLDSKRPKSGGRLKGTPNILTHELRETLKHFISSEIDNLSKEDVLSKLTYSERLVFLTKILPYVLPKVQPLLSEYDSQTEWNI